MIDREENSEFLLTSADCRSVGFCARGQREFCKANGIDYLKFFREGLPFSAFEGIEDHNLKVAMDAARKRTEG